MAKHFCLLFSSLLFLGEVEVSASANTSDSRVSFHNSGFSQSVATTDEIFSENGEERDIESRSDLYVLTDNVSLPQVAFIRTYLFPDNTFLPSGRDLSLQNSRAPPQI